MIETYPRAGTLSRGVPFRPSLQRRPCLRSDQATGGVRPPVLIHGFQALLGAESPHRGET